MDPAFACTLPAAVKPRNRAYAADLGYRVVAPGNRPLDQLTEAELVYVCLEGRLEAFDLIVERHRRPVYQLCYRFVGNHEDASDLSQDVFLRAYRGLRSFRGHASLSTWLYRIGVNVCLNRLRVKSALDPATMSSIDIDEQPLADDRHDSPSDAVLRKERAASDGES